jgi:hypothetical protein
MKRPSGWALPRCWRRLRSRPSRGPRRTSRDVGSQLTVLEGQTAQIGQLATSAASGAARQGPDYQERFADAELLYRLRDYARSAVLFTDIVENYANTPAFPQGLYLLGDALFQAGDRYGARTRFRQVLDHANEPVFRPFVQRALGRLIEIEIASAPTTTRAAAASRSTSAASGRSRPRRSRPRPRTPAGSSSSSAAPPTSTERGRPSRRSPRRPRSIRRLATSSARSSRCASSIRRPSRPSSG